MTRRALTAAADTRRRGARAADRTGFENQRALMGYRGFKSPPLRHPRAPLHSERSASQGEVSERLKEHAWKACVSETAPRVQIPPSPPIHNTTFGRAGTGSGPLRWDRFEPGQAGNGAALRAWLSCAGCPDPLPRSSVPPRHSIHRTVAARAGVAERRSIAFARASSGPLRCAFRCAARTGAHPPRRRSHGSLERVDGS